MSDKVAKAMLARNGMVLFKHIMKFRIVTKLKFGAEFTYTGLLREYTSIQFGPVTKGRSEASYRGEYFYQVLRALEKHKIIRRENANDTFSRHRHAFQDLWNSENIKLLDEAGIDYSGSEYFTMEPPAEALFGYHKEQISAPKLVHLLLTHGFLAVPSAATDDLIKEALNAS